MSSAWLRTPRLYEPEDFREHEAQHERHDASRALVDRFGEFTPPRPTVRETCRACSGAGSAGKFACLVCRGKGYRNLFVDRPSASIPTSRVQAAIVAECGASGVGFRRRARSSLTR